MLLQSCKTTWGEVVEYRHRPRKKNSVSKASPSHGKTTRKGGEGIASTGQKMVQGGRVLPPTGGTAGEGGPSEGVATTRETHGDIQWGLAA